MKYLNPVTEISWSLANVNGKYDDLGTTLGAAVVPTLVSDGGITYNNFGYVTVGAVNSKIPQLTCENSQNEENPKQCLQVLRRY